MNERSEGAARPAGFWIRAAALAVDLVVFGLVQFSLGYAAGRIWGPGVEDSSLFQVTVVVFTVVFTGLYTTFLHALDGQTLGKLLVGIRVVGTDGARLPVGTALLRYFAYYVALAPLGAGFLMAGLRSDKRGLHDLLAGSRVERRRATRRSPDAAPPAEPAPPAAG